jgi:hypothetical protein
MSVQIRQVTRYPVIRLAKLALWALQGDHVASAWRPCDDHVCGTVAISAGEKKTKKKQKIERNCDKHGSEADGLALTLFAWAFTRAWTEAVSALIEVTILPMRFIKSWAEILTTRAVELPGAGV